MNFYVDLPKLDSAVNRLAEVEYGLNSSAIKLERIQDELKSLRMYGVENSLNVIVDDLHRQKHETRALLNLLDRCIDIYKDNENMLIELREMEDYINSQEKAEGENPFDFDIFLMFLVHKPDGMSDEEYLDMLRDITKEVEAQRGYGWDPKATNCYVKKLNDALADSDGSDYSEIISNIHDESTMVGSDVYTDMLKASGLSDKEKADLVIDQMGGTIDENGMLQLTGDFKFDPNMPPHADFYDVLSDCVTNSYGKKGADYDGADVQKIHQLRYYIDYQNITYIREHYKGEGMTDEDALRAYVFDENGLNGDLMDAEPARYHNKFPTTTTYEEYYGGREQNRKRLTPDFHSEFIIDGNGDFVSQWNVLEWNDDGTVISDYQYYYDEYNGENASSKPYTWDEAKMQVANTESFNYADSNGDVHEIIDSGVVNDNDPNYRQNMREGLASPEKGQYKQKYEMDDDFSKKR